MYVTLMPRAFSGFIENAVALGAVDTLIAQDGVTFTLRQITESMARFEERASAVESRYLTLSQAENAENVARSDVENFVDSCRYLVRGSVSWRLVCSFRWLIKADIQVVA
jgi:hypothetical protein